MTKRVKAPSKLCSLHTDINISFV